MRRRDFIKALGGISGAWLSAAHAQQASKIPRIGVLWHAGNEEEERIPLGALREGLRRAGYIEGQNIILENRFPNEQPDRFQSLATELADLKVDLIVTVTRQAALAAQRATTTIPIVFLAVPDPLESKLVNNWRVLVETSRDIRACRSSWSRSGSSCSNKLFPACHASP